MLNRILSRLIIVAALTGWPAGLAVTAAEAAGQFPVNTFTTLNQWLPSIGRLPDGGFVVVWQSDYQRANPDEQVGDIYAQRFAANGDKVGGEFPVNKGTIGGQTVPAVAVLADGSFVVIWVSDRNSDESGHERILGQRFSPEAEKVGGQFRVHGFTTGTSNNPAIAALADGGFVVVWADSPDGASADSYRILAQRFAANGDKAGARLRVNQTDQGAQWRTAVAALADGGFVVAWDSVDDDGARAVRGQRYAADGTTAGDAFTVIRRPGGQRRPRISALAGGGFVIVWEGLNKQMVFNVYAQLYSNTGVKLGKRIRVAPKGANQFNPNVSGLAGGGFLVAWADEFADIRAQRLAANGTPVGDVFRVNDALDQIRDWPVIAPSANGGFAIAWDAQDASGLGVFARRYKH